MRRVVTWLSVVAVAMMAACGDAVARVEPTGPGLSLAPTVNLYGQSPVRQSDNCEYYGIVSNGTAPYTWTWSWTGSRALSPDVRSATTQSVVVYTPGNFTIYLTITDAEGRTASASKSVTASWTAPNCDV
jgi:hypothetical protein